MIELIVTLEGEAPKRHPFDKPRITIGRDQESDLVLDSPGCSRHHAEIVAVGDGYKIADLGSTNGVMVGAKRITEHPLTHGTVFTIGEHRVTVALPLSEASERTVRFFYGGAEAGAPTAAPGASASPPVTPDPPTLYLLFGPRGKERSVKIVAGAEYLLGRSPSADLVLEDSESSKRHAMIFTRDSQFRIKDLGSANGTFLGTRRVEDEPLAPGDEIVIGSAVIQVRDQVLDLADEAELLSRTRLGIPTLKGLADLERAAVGEAPAPARAKPALVAVAILAVLVVLAGGLWATFRWVRTSAVGGGAPGAGAVAGPAQAMAAPTIVQVAPVVVSELVSGISTSGSVKAHQSAMVSAEVPARIMQISVDAGDSVAEGQTVVLLNDRDIRHQLTEARSSISKEQVDLAREDYQRKGRLFEQGAIVRSVYDLSKNNYLSLDSAYGVAQARISQLNEQLSKTRIASPFAGVVVRRFVNEGEFVGPGTPIVSVENSQRMLVQVELPDRDFVRVTLGQAVEVTTDAFENRVFRGVVDRLGSAANPVTKTFEVEARIDNEDFSLRTGMIATLRILGELQRGLVVPVEALVEEHDGRGVVFSVEGGIARRVDVPLGQRVDRVVQVLEGLSEGGQVVVFGQAHLVDGQSVKIAVE